MTATEFILYVKAKLNRLDTAAYEDVRDEEVLFFANEAQKSLALEFDSGRYSALVDSRVLQIYLNELDVKIPETNCTSNKAAVPANLLKIKDISAEVTAGNDTGWVPCISRGNELVSHKEDNPFDKSYPDRPHYRVLEDEIVFDVSGFSVNKFKGFGLKFPEEIDGNTTLSFPFMEELENKTVTLLLENLESRRIETQPAVSKM